MELYNHSCSEKENRELLSELFKSCPIPANEVINHVPSLFMQRQQWTRFLFYNEIYKQILTVNGSIFEFGVRYGTGMAIYECLRGIYEPYNHSRNIVGFDTFEGLAGVCDKDKGVEAGAYDSPDNYDIFLSRVLGCHHVNNPIAHIPTMEILKGDVSDTLPKYLNENKHTIIALANFDFDIYKPTKDALMEILPSCVKGTILMFDELNFKKFPGETEAIAEVFGLNNIELKRNQFSSLQSYFIL